MRAALPACAASITCSRRCYGLNPTALRRHGKPKAQADVITLKLAYRPPLDWSRLIAFLVSRGATGVECAQGQRYLRTANLRSHRGWFAAEPLPKESGASTLFGRFAAAFGEAAFGDPTSAPYEALKFFAPTAECIAQAGLREVIALGFMRALGYPDAFPHADLGLIKALGLQKSRDILAAAETWRPWRAYAAHHLWANLK